VRKPLKTRSKAAALLRLGIIAGVIVAALLFPLVAVAGLVTKSGADALDKAPPIMTIRPSAQTTYVYLSDNKTLLTTFYEEHRKYTSLSEMSPYILQAIIASEDSRFYQHNGVDAKGVLRAFVANRQAGEVSQGASTLTMQYVRQALRDNAETPADVRAATEQTAARKLKEMRLAVEMEKQLSKAEILERYLNMAYFGHRAYGIYAAAEVFFSKTPKNLTLAEAAMLAGVVKAPSAYDPAVSDRKAATDRRGYVIDRMTQLGYVSPATGEQAKKEPIKLKLSYPPNDCVSIPDKLNDWGFFCDLLKNWWMRQPAFGKNEAERSNALHRGGYRIVVSLDPKIQEVTRDSVASIEGDESPYALGTVAVEPRTGVVKAMAVNRRYALDQSQNGRNSNTQLAGKIPGSYPNTTNALLGGGHINGYQAGSTFKFFTMLAALDSGMKLDTTYYSPMQYKSKFVTGGGDASCGDVWCPRNASGAMVGFQDMRTGFGKSVNTYFAQLIEAVGAEKTVRMAEKLGLTWHTDVDQMMATQRANLWGAFTLGVSDTTPLEMAAAYATAAADGIYCAPLPVLSITNPDGTPATWKDEKGNPHKASDAQCKRAVSVAAARGATDAARCTTGYGASTGGCGGWSTASGVYGAVGRPVAGKTGTTDSTRSAWFVGYTPELSVASFLSDPDNPNNAVGDGQSEKPVFSASTVLRDGLKGHPVTYFPPVPESIR
jgi:membrane peptidoglycan carboxypeptidase